MRSAESLESRTLLAFAATPFGPSGSTGPDAFARAGASVVFVATASATGRELYATPGGGASLLADINRGPADSSPSHLVSAGSVAFFAASDGSSGNDVWRTDGTAAGTRKLVDLGPASRAGEVERLAVVRDRLVVLDGVNGRVASYAFDGSDLRVLDVLPAERELLFFASGPSGIVYGVEDESRELFEDPYEQLRSDGLAPSSVFATDYIGPIYGRGSVGPWVGIGGDRSTLFVDPADGRSRYLNVTLSAQLANGTILLAGASGLSVSDATLDEVTRLNAPSNIGGIAVVGNLAYFNAGPEIWRTDGTASGTYRLVTVAGRIPGLAAQVRNLHAFGDTLLFTTEGEGVNAAGRDLRHMTAAIGAPVGTVSIPRNVTNADPQALAKVGGTLYFSAQTSAGRVPFRLAVTSGEASGGRLRVAGTSGNDAITVKSKRVGGKWRILLTVNGRTETYLAGDARTIEVAGADGNDRIDCANVAAACDVSGGGGNDAIIGGTAGDTLSGGAGKDSLYGNDGDDRLNGNAGHDRLYGEGGDDRLYGGEQDDALDGGGNADRLYGEDGNDSLLGGSSNDRLYGGAGDDALDGGRGADLLDGGTGRDLGRRDEADGRVAIEILA